MVVRLRVAWVIKVKTVRKISVNDTKTLRTKATRTPADKMSHVATDTLQFLVIFQ